MNDSPMKRFALQKKHPLRPIFKWIVRILLALLAAAAFLLAAILMKPDDPPETDEAPALTASPALLMTSADDMYSAVAAFPAPVIGYPQNFGVTLTSGAAEDASFEGGIARLMTLTYQTSAGVTVTAQSICPRDAVSLIPRNGYEIVSGEPSALAGMSAVVMTDGRTIRYHAQGEQALYVITIPYGSASEAYALLQPLQLLIANAH